jgi:hypothetical protein
MKMFGWMKRKTVDFLDEQGRPSVRVSEKQFDRWVDKGYLTQVAKVRALDDGHQEVIWHWNIPEQVSLETYQQFKDELGYLHCITFRKEGVKQFYVTTKANYEDTIAKNIAQFGPLTRAQG